MPRNRQAADAALREPPAIQPGVSPKGAATLEYTLPVPVPRPKAAYVEGIHRKLQGLALPGMLAADRPAFGGTGRVFGVECLGYVPVSPQQAARTFSTKTVDQLLLDLAKKLEALHGNGILVLSLSPNFVLADRGSQPACALCGFLDAVDVSAPPAALSLYEPLFAAPEALAPADSSAFTPACDVYSLGLLYHLYLTGALPEEQEVPEDAEEGRGELRLSTRLDIPHKSLLARMLSPEAAQRPQCMGEIAREIERILRYGGCFLRVDCPDLANRFVTLSSQGISSVRKKLNQNGQAMIGPLLSDQQYTISFRKNIVFQVRFPKQGEKQVLRLSMDDQLSDTARVEEQQEVSQPPVWERELQPRLMQDTIRDTIVVDPPLNNICRIDLMTGSFCLLTLINGGSFWIRAEAAPRYGIDRLLQGKRGG